MWKTDTMFRYSQLFVAVTFLVGCTASTLATDDKTCTETATATTSAFLDWFEKNGGEASKKITIRHFENLGRGIATSGEHVLDGEKVLEVPLSLVIHKGSIAASGPGAKYLHDNIKLERELLPSFLALERCKGKDSFWFSYLQVLPEEISSAWGLEDHMLKELQDGKFERALKDHRENLVGTFKTSISSHLEKALKMDNIESCGSLQEMYIWGCKVVDSRGLNLKGTKYLVPYVDMFNYSPHPRPRSSANGDFFLKHHVLASSSIIVNADRNTEPNSQLVMDYGDNPTQIYLQYHGFVPDFNPFDCFQVPSPALASTEKLALAKKLQLPSKVHSCLRWNGIESRWSGSAAGYLHRISRMSEAPVTTCLEELNKAKGREAFSRAARKCMNQIPSNKQVLIELIEAWQQNFPTTLEEDERKLEGDLVPGMKLVYKYRIAQKRLVRDTLSFLQTGKAPEQGMPSVASLEETDKLMEKLERVDLSEALNLPLSTKIENLNKWVEELGFPVNKIKAAEVPNLRVGTIASEDINLEEPYLVVPSTALMDVENAPRSMLYPYLYHLSEILGKHDAFHELLLLFMFEYFVQGPRSFWWPYLALLPKAHEFYPPSFYNQEELDVLEGHDLVKAEVKKNINNVNTKFGRVKEFLKKSLGEKFIPDDVFTRENYFWVHAILDSRGIWWAGQRHLVPLLDMVNCKAGKGRVHATTYESQLGGAVTRAAQAYKKGEQVFEDYGQPNHIYFLYHGFSLANNRQDCFRVTLPLDATQRANFGLLKFGNPSHPSIRGKKSHLFCVRYPLEENTELKAVFGNDFTVPKEILKDIKLGKPIDTYHHLLENLEAGSKKHNAVTFMLSEKALLTKLID